MDLFPILTVSCPFLGDIYHGQIQHFQETVIGWKYRLGFGDFSELAVKSFNRVRGIDQTSDSFRILPYREVLAEIRKKGKLPVIVLTAKDGLDEKVQVLTNGADDYITKPFEIREVLARIQVQLRHKEEKETEEEHNLSFKKMVLNRDTFQVKIDGKILSKITKQEFAILELLLRNPKQVFSKEDIFEYAWDEPYMGETKTLDVHISNIRKKIKTVTSEEYIETVWGIGYRLHV